MNKNPAVESKAWGWLKPSAALSLLIFAVSVGLMAFFRFYLYHQSFITLTYGLPLLLCLWQKDRLLLWSMAAAFTLMAIVKTFLILPDPDPYDLPHFLQWSMQVINIFLIGSVVHLVINLTERLHAKNVQLGEANLELAERADEIERQNAELQVQAEELNRQNEEIQAQSEELAHQNEELAQHNEEIQQQAEELEQQTEELRTQAEDLQNANEELQEREGMLQIILDSLRNTRSEPEILTRICQSLHQLVGPAADAVAVVFKEGQDLVLRNQVGLAVAEKKWPLAQSLAAIVMEKNQTAYVSDLALRPDLSAPSLTGAVIRSILATPLRLRGGPIGVIEAYSAQPQHWAQRHFHLLEWVSVQYSMALEIIHLRDDLQASETRLRSMVDTIPQLAWMAEPDGHIFWYNQRWYDYTGTTFEQMKGWGWQHVHDPQFLPMVMERWKASLESGQPFEMDFPLRGADGKFRWFLTRIMPLRDDTGRLVRWLGTNTDISEKREASQALLKARQQADAANQAKSQFLASMSHELRTPMNAILGMTDLTLGLDLPPKAREFLQISKESASQLLELLNEVLDFSRIEDGRFELESIPFSLLKTIEQVVRNLGVRAYEKNLELIYDLPPDLPDQILGDPLRLRQILTNLVGNAIKFTSKGEIVVRALVEEKSGDETLLRFSVTDTGIGISPENQDKIFAPFIQADSSTTRHYGGSGLGLTICQRLVHLMGGRIWVESELGKGSAFHFTVRTKMAPEGSVSASLRLPEREMLRGLPVLVVSESETQRRVLQQILSSWFMQPEAVADVPMALAKIHQAAAHGKHFRLVLTDAVLTNINGFDLAEWLAKEPNLAGPVLLLLTAADRQNYPDKCKGVDPACVDKPFSYSTLFRCIVKSLGLDCQGLSLDPEPVARALPRPLRPLQVLLAEDTPANQKLVLHVLSQRGHRVEIAENGRKAVELLQGNSFDVVLMDVQMPEMDGFQATGAIRALDHPRKCAVPIIALTAHALKGDDQKCLSAGMNAYLSKPINAQELIEVVERWANHGPQEPSRSVAASLPPNPCVVHESKLAKTELSPPAVSPVPSELFSLDQAVSHCFGQKTVFQDMVECFYQEADPLLGQIEAALSAQKGEAAYQAAHRLLNTIFYLGSDITTKATRNLEQASRAGNLDQAAAALAELKRLIEGLQQALGAHRKTTT